MTSSSDRISPFTVLLDEVVYQSSIRDMRASYFQQFGAAKSWLLFSDYYFGDDKTNQAITFTAVPLVGNVSDLQNLIRQHAPSDIKNTRTIQDGFIELLKDLPVLTFSFVFPINKYLAWPNGPSFQGYMASYCDTLSEYIRIWQDNPTSAATLTRMARNISYVRGQLTNNKKPRIICQAFLIGVLGGYVGGTLCRETELTHLCWMSDRDKTNELGSGFVQDVFQTTTIDIAKKNIMFSFTSAKSSSDEWYPELTRIPDILTGAIAGFDFGGTDRGTLKPGAQNVIRDYLHGNRSDWFVYRFVQAEEGVKIQRMLVARKA